jgi:enoyl-CoA hydratase/carnithine racemase
MDEFGGIPEAPPKFIVCKEQKGMFQIILNRPPINAFNADMVEEIYRALAAIQYRTDLKVVVFSAAGKNFCGGFAQEDFAEERSYQLIEAFGRMFEQIQALNIPVVSVVQGLALSAGFEIVIFSDLAIAAESSRFGLPDIKIGLFPALASYLLPIRIPAKRAAELILTGEPVSSRDAEKLGLVNVVVPDDKLAEQAGLFINRLVKLSGPVLQCAKRAMNDSAGRSIDDGLRAVEDIFLNQLLQYEDWREGIAAFRENRKPNWKNQ